MAENRTACFEVLKRYIRKEMYNIIYKLKKKDIKLMKKDYLLLNVVKAALSSNYCRSCRDSNY